jgi:hypothetical protein
MVEGIHAVGAGGGSLEFRAILAVAARGMYPSYCVALLVSPGEPGSHQAVKIESGSASYVFPPKISSESSAMSIRSSDQVFALKPLQVINTHCTFLRVRVIVWKMSSLRCRSRA